MSIAVRANPYFVDTGPDDDTIITEAEPVTLTARVGDVETISSALTVGWVSSLDGPRGDTTADSLGHAELTTSSLSAGLHVITVNKEKLAACANSHWRPALTATET